MANQMLTRKEKTGKKSAIIFTSSVFADNISPGVAMYSASKVFNTYMAEALNFEWKDKVDVLSYRAGCVDTNLNPNKGIFPGYITTERAATCCLRDLGLQPVTYGDW